MLKRSEKRYPLVRHLCKKKRSRSRTKIIVYIENIEKIRNRKVVKLFKQLHNWP